MKVADILNAKGWEVATIEPNTLVLLALYEMNRRNKEKSSIIYRAIDESGGFCPSSAFRRSRTPWAGFGICRKRSRACGRIF